MQYIRKNVSPLVSKKIGEVGWVGVVVRKEVML